MPNPPFNFENSLKKLESIVESIESGDTSLDQLVQKFEEGNIIINHCKKYLNSIELKIDKIKSNSNDTEPFSLNP